MGPCNYISMETSLEKSNFFFCYKQLSITDSFLVSSSDLCPLSCLSAWDPVWLGPVQTLPHCLWGHSELIVLCLWGHMCAYPCICKVLFPWGIPCPLALPIFLVPLLPHWLDSGERGLMKILHFGLSASLCTPFPMVDLCVRSHILQEETSLVMAEKGTDLWVY